MTLSVTQRKLHLTTRRGFQPGRWMGSVERLPGAAPDGLYPDLTARSVAPYDVVDYYDDIGRLIDSQRIDWS